MAHLTLVVQGREVRKFVLNAAVTTIGRAQDNDIVINNLALSRRHAEVLLRSGRFQVSDLGSQNGVFVNAERVLTARVLRNTDTITLGTYVFVFSDDSASDPDIRGAKPRRRVEVTQLEDVKDAAGPDHGALLVLKYNDVELQRTPVRGENCLVGRAKDCDIQIAERRLSRRHCQIKQSNGRHIIQDLGSQNGTYVNRKRIQGQQDLHHGDVLNFAEYSVLFLSDAGAYDGPDSIHAQGRAVAPAPQDANFFAEETEFPEAYAEDRGYDEPPRPAILGRHDSPLRPSEHDEDPDAIQPLPPMAIMPTRPREDAFDKGEPFVEEPGRARNRRKPRAVVEVQNVELGAPDRNERPSKKKQPKKKKKKKVANSPRVRVGRRHQGDIDDEASEARPDPSLKSWYAEREEKSDVLQSEPSVLLERSKSSMSQLLSTMMVDKREVDKSLGVNAKQRRFFVDVLWGDEKISSGPLREQVTILGTDSEADIKLKGRYVAGRHSILVRVRDSLLLVRLGSSSAARVNGLPKLQAFLKSGDIVQIDETTIKITEE